MSKPDLEEIRSAITDACYVECADCGAKAVVAADVVDRNLVDEKDAVQRLLKEEWVVNEDGFMMCGTGQGKGCAGRGDAENKITDLYHV